MLNDRVRTWSRRMALVTAAVSLITLAAPGNSTAYLEDADAFKATVQQPPTSDAYTYGEFGPEEETTFPLIGNIYVKGQTTDPGDPVFGGTVKSPVRRITNDFPHSSRSDIYSKNGFWSADGKLMYHMTPLEEKTIINTHTGASVPVPGDYKGFDGSFAPDDVPGSNAYRWYFFSGSMLMRYVITLNADGTLGASAPELVKDFKAFRARTLAGLGGSVDWIDNSGAHMVLNLDGKVRVWNQPVNKLYSGSVSATGADWIGISPDGKYVVTSTDKGFYSYAINHDAGTLATRGVLFWTLCGGHGDLVSASDGKTYVVTFDCYGSTTDSTMLPAIYAVDVAPPASVTGRTESGRNAQRQANTKLFEVAWGEDGHFSGVSKGALRNWAFISIESSEDTFGLAIEDSWWNRPYMQEIVMVNVVSAQVLRVAHHRSRSISDTYFYQPRVSANWGDCAGASAAWASNFGVQAAWDPETDSYNYADIYAVDVAAADVLPDPTPACLP